MHILLIVIGSFLILGAAEILLLRFLTTSWWRRRWVRIAALVLPASGILALFVGMLGFYVSSYSLVTIGMTAASLAAVLVIGLTVSLPLAGILNASARLVERRRVGTAECRAVGPPVSRRNFLRSSAALFPIAATATGISGFASSFSRVKVHELPLSFENLPDQIDGLRILHLSDMHLGRYFQLADLEQTLEDAEKLAPDITLVTGDICDVSSRLCDTLRMIAQLKPRLGSWASIGNHEYYHGINLSLSAHSRSEIPLLINEGRAIPLEGGNLYVCGADDPASLFGNQDDFLRRTVQRALADAPPGAFRIVMSHRPRGFAAAAEHGTELTLAGHTHGGQIGMFGRSVFETCYPPNYYWGHYSSGTAQLYTSAGVGHWFPFRLGCPAEAPVLVLRRESAVPDGQNRASDFD